MSLHTLPAVVDKRKKRLGRGASSGRGKTSGRGTKGQKARNKVMKGFEGGQLKLIKRLPLLRGRSRNKAFKKKPIIVDISRLIKMPKNTVVTMESLHEYKIIELQKAKLVGVKILGNTATPHALTIEVPISSQAKKRIEDAGGKVTSSIES